MPSSAPRAQSQGRSRPPSRNGPQQRPRSAHSAPRTRPGGPHGHGGKGNNPLGGNAIRQPTEEEQKIMEIMEQLSELPDSLSKTVIPPPKTSYLAYDEEDVGKERFDRMEKVAKDVIQTLDQNDPKSSTNVSLSGVQFSIPFYHDLASCFLHNNRVRKLFLDGCNIGDEESHILAYMMKPNQALQVVSLQQNHIRSIGAGHLARIFGRIIINYCINYCNYFDNNELNKLPSLRICVARALL